MPDDFQINLTASVTDFVSGMQEAAEAATSAGESTKEALTEGGAGEAMEKLGEQSNEAVEKIAKLGEGLKGVAEIMGLGV